MPDHPEYINVPEEDRITFRLSAYSILTHIFIFIPIQGPESVKHFTDSLTFKYGMFRAAWIDFYLNNVGRLKKMMPKFIWDMGFDEQIIKLIPEVFHDSQGKWKRIADNFIRENFELLCVIIDEMPESQLTKNINATLFGVIEDDEPTEPDGRSEPAELEESINPVDGPINHVDDLPDLISVDDLTDEELEQLDKEDKKKLSDCIDRELSDCTDREVSNCKDREVSNCKNRELSDCKDREILKMSMIRILMECIDLTLKTSDRPPTHTYCIDEINRLNGLILIFIRTHQKNFEDHYQHPMDFSSPAKLIQQVVPDMLYLKRQHRMFRGERNLETEENVLRIRTLGELFITENSNDLRQLLKSISIKLAEYK